MSTITRNRVGFRRQGTFTAANTTYPVDLVTDPNIRYVAPAATSNTNGVKMPENYCNEDVVITITCDADTAPTAGVAVYGYVRQVLTAEPGTFSLNDYTGSDVLEIPWQHIHSLNDGAVIAVTTGAIGAVNVIATSATSWIYNEVIRVGAMYERIRVIPVVLTGTNPTLHVDVGFAGGQR